MALAHEVRSFFSGKVRLRGHEYFERRAVVIERGDAWNVRAVVRGTERYQVGLSRGASRRDPASSTITAWCTCPYAQDGEACKHIWAAILAATAQGLLGGDGHQPVANLRLGSAAAARLGDGLESDVSGAGIGAGVGAGRARRVPGRLDALGDALTLEDGEEQDAAVAAADGYDGDADDEVGDEGEDEGDEFLADDANGDVAGLLGDVADRRRSRDSERRGRSGSTSASASMSTSTLEKSGALREPGWRQQIATFLPPPTPASLAPAPPHAHTRELIYVLDLEASGANGSLTLEIGWRDRKVNGEWGRYRTKSYLRDEVMGAATPEDERILALQHASDVGANYAYGAYRRPVISNHVQLPPALVDVLMPGLCATGRCLLRRAPDDEEWAPLAWDAGDPWELRLELTREQPDDASDEDASDDEPDPQPNALETAVGRDDDFNPGNDRATAAFSAAGGSSSARESSASPHAAVATLDARTAGNTRSLASGRETCVLRGALHRGDERIEWSSALLILSGGHLVTPTHVARFTHRGDLGWIAFLAREGQLVVPCDELDALFTEMTRRPGAPVIDISPDLDVHMVKAPPRRRLSVRAAPDSGGRPVANDDGLTSAPDAVRPRSDALRSGAAAATATDALRAAASRWSHADSARHEGTRRDRIRDDTGGDDGEGAYGGGRGGLGGGRAGAGLGSGLGGGNRFRADQRLTSPRDTLHADVTFEYAYGGDRTPPRPASVSDSNHGHGFDAVTGDGTRNATDMRAARLDKGQVGGEAVKASTASGGASAFVPAGAADTMDAPGATDASHAIEGARESSSSRRVSVAADDARRDATEAGVSSDTRALRHQASGPDASPATEHAAVAGSGGASSERIGDAGDATADAGVTPARGIVSVRWDAPTERLFVPGPPLTLIDRDRDAEREALRQLGDAGLRPVQLAGAGSRMVWELRASRLPDAVRRLIAQGWAVEAEGRKHRTATATRAQVRSGIDWFDLEGVVEFGEVSAPIGVVVAALARGETAITLSDGSQGLLPEEWLTRHGPWAGLAERRGDSVRFTRGQVAVLDAWVAAAPAIDVDAQFAQARQALRAFTGVEAADPPAEFRGELRAYQREGLGWIQFVERFGFGGCLADDMGLGKTVQVLAALAGRRTGSGAMGSSATGSSGNEGSASPARPTRPSLVVVPRSLVFNWQREAARFAPSLRVLDHTGPNRSRDGAGFDEADLIITTYGTVRRDAELLARIEFDYVVLDEAHAIKNVDSLTTKAVRLLRGRHRLALTGTPVQNHIGELWSLFEFLNPGMLGRSRAFARAMNSAGSGLGAGAGAGSGASGRSGTSSAPRDALARVLRPFILRRTKADVARDLPARVEDTVVCRLSGAERQRYNELRDYYRQTLAQRITKEGWNKARLHVLKALLRLRQAACHPGLVDRTQIHAPSAKLDVLLSDLRLLREEGHKTIVFSQFVRFLDIVRLSLDREGVPYEYLDGRTRDREARVERFQTDPDCPLFLVSLKAGGLGLNLTAAEYVFLLDPWWNPAIEAQAIDRAHRIGQTRAVFAYRLIAEDTIEEKIIELQARKRELADAIVGADGGALQKLTREDLEVLLS